MRKIIICIVILCPLLISSCTTYLIYSTKSITKENAIEKVAHAFKDKSILIEYDFWSDGGIMSFTVSNLSDKPIYIDWFKSSLIRNGNTLRYFKNKEEKNVEYNTKGAVISNSAGNRSVAYTNLSGNETTYKEERISFIPPYSKITKSTYSFVLIGDYLNKGDEVEFSINNSPVVFSNYITYSFKEDMKDEISISHLFFVNNLKCITKCKISNSFSPRNFYIKNEIPVSNDGY